MGLKHGYGKPQRHRRLKLFFHPSKAKNPFEGWKMERIEEEEECWVGEDRYEQHKTLSR